MTKNTDLSGYISLHRKIKNSSVFANEGLLKVWIWCLTSASRKGGYRPYKSGKGEKEIKVKPGQFIYGRLTAATELSMNPNTVRTRLKKLEAKGMIKIVPRKNYSLIYIIKWHIYQPDPDKKYTKINGNKPEINMGAYDETEDGEYVFR